MDTIVFGGKLLAELVPLFVVISTAVYVAVEALTPARIRGMLSGRSQWLGVPFAALLGAVTPFCSCSTVPLVSGMRQAGIPLVSVVAFLTASPLISPVALLLLWTAIGPEYALLYAGAALVISIGGAVLVSSWYGTEAQGLVPALVGTGAGCGPVCGAAGRRPGRSAGLPVVAVSGPARMTLTSRIAPALRKSLADLRKLWPALVVAVALGAVIHGQIPDELLVRVAGPDVPWAVPVAALLGLPVYASIFVLVPIGVSLLAKGVGVGVVTAFLMGASGFSIPEGILLARVLPMGVLVRVLAVFAAAVMLIGYGFEWLLGR